MPKRLAHAHLAAGLKAHKKKLANATAHYEVALRLDPESSRAAYNLACAYSLGKRPSEALSLIEELLKKNRKKWAPIIAKDADFKSLRDNARFKRLLGK